MQSMSFVFRRGALLLALAGIAAPAPAANSTEATAATAHHRSRQGSAAASAAANRSEPAGDWSTRLAVCQAKAGGNPVGREKCVWSHCNGHWGKGNCPPGSDWPPKFRIEKFEKFGRSPGADGK